MRLPVLCFAICGLAAPLAADPALLTVQGDGRVSVSPDIARLSFGVSAQGETAGDAMSEMNGAARAVLDFLLTDEGLDSADVQTGQLSLSPRYPEGRYGEGQIIGYDARTSVDVVVRDLSRLGGIMDAAIAEGANGLGALNFDLADRSSAQDEARRRAVADAQARAALYADAAGVSLGPIVALSETGASPVPMGMVASYVRSEAAIAEGSVDISASVTIVYSLEDEAP